MAKDLDAELAEACKVGDAGVVRDAIARGADIESRHSVYEDHGMFFEQVTPLMVACWSPTGSVEAVETLLELGADPHAKSAGGVTALWYAAGGGDDFHHGSPYDDESFVERLQTMIGAGCDPNDVADNGRSALAEAAAQGGVKRVKLLLDAGAKPDAIAKGTMGSNPVNAFLKEVGVGHIFDSTGGPDTWEVPLFGAAASGSVETVQALLDAGADAKVKSSDGKTAVCFAKTPEVLQMLLQAGTPLRSVLGWSDELDEAFDDERYDVAEALIEAAGGLSGWGDPGERLERYVGVNMDPKAVQLLIDHGAPLDHRGEHGATLLHTLAWQGDGNGGRENEVVVGVMRILLDAGLDPRAKNDRGWEPIHEAVDGDWGSPTSLRMLLEAGADPDARTRDGETALMLAAGRADVECVRTLLEHGADPSLRKGMKTALSLAKSYHKGTASWGAMSIDTIFGGAYKRLNEALGVEGGEDFFSKESNEERAAEAREKAAEVIRLLEEAGG